MRAAPALVAGAVALTLVAGVAQATDEIVIEAAAVRPPVLTVPLGERVAFVNRSGRTFHLEFTGEPGEHEVSQVAGRIWATFLRPGRHAYVVHFYAPRARDLHGAVEVVDTPGQATDRFTCDGTELGGICIER